MLHDMIYHHLGEGEPTSRGGNRVYNNVFPMVFENTSKNLIKGVPVYETKTKDKVLTRRQERRKTLKNTRKNKDLQDAGEVKVKAHS